jgi:hypothetical protein
VQSHHVHIPAPTLYRGLPSKCKAIMCPYRLRFLRRGLPAVDLLALHGLLGRRLGSRRGPGWTGRSETHTDRGRSGGGGRRGRWRLLEKIGHRPCLWAPPRPDWLRLRGTCLLGTHRECHCPAGTVTCHPPSRRVVGLRISARITNLGRLR